MKKIIDLICAPWAILPDWGDHVHAIYERWASGGPLDMAAIEARTGKPLAGPSRGYEVRNGVAIIPMQGVISQRINMMSDVSGGTSSELLARDITAAADDPKISAIVIDADTPGGAVAGTPGAAAALFRARQIKPTALLVGEQAASAGYWIGSAAEQVYMGSPVALAGSIGVMIRHVSKARAMEAAGLDVTQIYAGKYKTVGSDAKKLSDTDKAVIQDRVDALYSIFVNDVARNRERSVEQVLSDMADGRVFIGQQAIDAGLADGFRTMDELVAEMTDRGKWRPIAGGARMEQMASTGPPVVAQLPPVESSMSSLSEEVASWAAKNPDAANALRAEGAASEREKFAPELEAAKATARAEGAASEAQRAAEVRAQSLPGHEALIERLAADGRTTGPEAAQAVLAAERQLRANASTTRNEQAPAPLAFAVAPEKEKGSESVANPNVDFALAQSLASRAQQIEDEAKAAGRSINTLQAIEMAKTEHFGNRK